jgi:hypothetical protein
VSHHAEEFLKRKEHIITTGNNEALPLPKHPNVKDYRAWRLAEIVK